MNNNGKANFILILLIPVFFVITLIIVDTFVSYLTNKNYKRVTENIIREVMENKDLDYEEYFDEIKRLYKINNYDTDMLVVSADEYKVTVDNEHKYFGIISSITNKSGEDTKVNILGVEFNVKKGSKISISVEAKYDYNNELVFEYVD